MEFLIALQASPLGQWVETSFYAHPMLLVFHALGMAAVVGVVLAFDLRVLGYARGIPLMAFERMLPLAWAGFGLNAISGLVIFSANAPKLVANWSFQTKMGLILLGGLSVWLLWRRIRRQASANGDSLEATRADKVIAALSILFWIGALWAGRMIAYTLLPF